MKKAIKNYLSQLHENEEKGFSLVELIIVMAIMAILVGVVASQVIPYMEKSRQSKDQQQLSEIATAMVSAEAESPVSVGTFGPVKLDALTDNTGASGTDKTNIGTTLAGLLSTDASVGQLSTIESNITAKFKSKKFKEATGGIKVSYDAAKGKTYVYVGADSDYDNEGLKTTVISD